MTRKKETYITINRYPTSSRIYYASADGNVETVTDKDGNAFRIGYHYNHECRAWIATELSTGHRLNPGAMTKAEAIKFVQDNIYRLNDSVQALCRNNPSLISEFRAYAESAGIKIFPT